MPYLRITCPRARERTPTNHRYALDRDHRYLAVRPRGRITPQELRERTTVHFTPYAPEELFIGGQTPEARNATDITIELSDWGLSARQRRRLARGLTPVVADVFRVPRAGWDGINIRFHSYRPNEFAVGGRLLSELVPPVGQLLRWLVR